MAMCFPSIAPTQWGIFQKLLKSSAIFFHCSDVLGGLKYVSLKASQMAEHVSCMILLTVVLPILYAKDMLCCEFPEAKYLIVSASLSAGSIACLVLVSFFLMAGPTFDSK